MNEEEKKAIEKVKEIIYNPEFRNIILCDSEGFTGWNINFEIILNLIEKQQKEIADLEMQNHIIRDMNLTVRLSEEVFDETYIRKDKLKDIMKKHEKFLVNELSNYPEDDIENRKAIQYALARLSFLLTDILKED